MALRSEDDFWNTSSSSGFNFDDDEEICEPLTDVIFTTVREDSVMPIHSLISKNDLDLILDDIRSVHETIVPPVEEIIRKMFNGQKYYLESYKKLSDKLLLLDAALNTRDGNIIINVLLFLRRTLKQNIFLHHLARRKTAIKPYASYLMANGHIQELADVYMATGNNMSMKQLYYLIGRDYTAKDVLYRKLEQFVAEHLQRYNNNDEKLEIQDSMKLLGWQVENKQTADSVIEQLAVMCQSQWEPNSPVNYCSASSFKTKLRVDDFAYDWTVMNVLASKHMWQELLAYFIRPNWLTKKNTLKTVIPSEILVYGLSRHSPPPEELEIYLACIPDVETSLLLAQKVNCHRFIIQHYVNQRDRQALIALKSRVKPLSDEYYSIDNALQSDKRWKN